MSFQAYLDNIQTKTGKSPADFRKLAEGKGFLKKGKIAEGVKATEIVKPRKTSITSGTNLPMEAKKANAAGSRTGLVYPGKLFPPYLQS